MTLQQELEKVIERHKWNTAKYVLDNKTLDVGKSSQDLSSAIIELLVKKIVFEEKEEVLPKGKYGVRKFDKRVGYNIYRAELLELLGGK